MAKTNTILIIEDEKALSTALETKLSASGFDTLVAANGVDGLKMAIKEHPDLILLDIVLPQLDGLSVLDQLRTDPWGKTVPVIMLTNLTQVDAQEESKERGVQAFLIKTDWKLEEVVQKIREILGISASNPTLS